MLGIGKTNKPQDKHHIPLSAGMVLVALGVVYGDIGTSPMYTMKAIVAGNGGLSTMGDGEVIGALSLIIWTLTLITTVKYVIVAFKADNHGQGGIFALYSLVRHCGKWLLIPAMIGAGALLADGILTPAVTVTTAVEGLKTIGPLNNLLGNNQTVIIVITVIIISGLFIIQRSGVSSIGKMFGPVMTIWFAFMAFAGIECIAESGSLEILKAFNPFRGLDFLFNTTIFQNFTFLDENAKVHPSLNLEGLLVLGNVFLCATGAEALYSDMGHVGKKNIYVSWPFVKICLIINYLGQGAFLLTYNDDPALLAMTSFNPFFEMLPDGDAIRIFAVALSTLAAIIASQALITGSFSIASEGIHLDLIPHMRICYPSQEKGQIYIPLLNNIMWVGCVVVVLFFQTSSRMEAAYGLAITVTMLMSTILLTVFLWAVRKHKLRAAIFFIVFMAIEGMFFFASLSKFVHGGYFTVLLGAAYFFVMFVWWRGTAVEAAQTDQLPVRDYIGQLKELSQDESLPLVADNLVFITYDSTSGMIDRDILYSIFDKRPKRARAYFFIDVDVTDEPDTLTYEINNFGTDFIFKVQLSLGFHMHQRIREYLNTIVEDLVRNGELPPQPHKYSIMPKKSQIGDFRYCIIYKELTDEYDLSKTDRLAIGAKYVIRSYCGSPINWYDLNYSAVLLEYVPLFTKKRTSPHLKRLEFKPEGEDTAASPEKAELADEEAKAN